MFVAPATWLLKSRMYNIPSLRTFKENLFKNAYFGTIETKQQL